ncbi:MAG: TetR/AcrR family transcriptional regulator [Bacillota bacterium]
MEDIKNLILDKAKERMERFGFKKTTMDEISADCRISKKTIYLHFRDKEDMFTCLIMREFHKMLDVIFARMGVVPDPRERLISLTRTAIQYFNEDNFTTRILKDDDALFSVFLSRKFHSLIDEEIISLVAGIIREGKEQGQFHDVDEKVVAYAHYKLFQAFSYLRTARSWEKPQEYYTEILLDLLEKTLVKKGD